MVLADSDTVIPVVRLAPGEQWDQTLLDDLLAGELWPHGIAFEDRACFPRDATGIVLVVPGRYWADRATEISQAISKYRWVLAFRTSDEEDLFDIRKVAHPAIRWWIQTPRVGKDYGSARFMPLGYTPHCDLMSATPPEKLLDVFLSAQSTHRRREEAFAALESGERRRVEPTAGFTQGMDPVEYVRCMTTAKIAPAPSGAVSPDSFRVWEALEAHAIPIADDVSPIHDSRGYWRMLLGDPPFPVLTDYQDLSGWIDDVLADWPRQANRITAWWMGYKRGLARALRNELAALGAFDARADRRSARESDCVAPLDSDLGRDAGFCPAPSARQ